MNKKHHFVYKLTHESTKEFYIGMHSTCDIDDGYMGSMVTWRVDKSKLKKEIISYHKSREELSLFEAEAILDNYNHPLNRNAVTPLKSLVILGRGSEFGENWKKEHIAAKVREEKRLKAKRYREIKKEKEEWNRGADERKRIEKARGERLEKELKEREELEKNIIDSGSYIDILMCEDIFYDWYLFLEENVKGFNSEHAFRYHCRTMYDKDSANEEIEIRKRVEKLLEVNEMPDRLIDCLYDIQFKYYFFNYKNELRCARLIYREIYQTTQHKDILGMALNILEPNKEHEVFNERSSCDVKFFNKKRNLHESNETSELIKKGGFWSYFVIHKKDELPEGCKFI